VGADLIEGDDINELDENAATKAAIAPTIVVNNGTGIEQEFNVSCLFVL
jgi:hypothetical protein